MTKTDALRYEIAAANAYGRAVKVPEGVFELDYPIRYPTSGVFRGDGRATLSPENEWLAGTLFRPKTIPATPSSLEIQYYTPLLLAVPPLADLSPIDGNGLHPDAQGWFNLSDYFHPNPTTEFCFEIDFTLDSLPADGERLLACAQGTIGLSGVFPGVMDSPLDIPFRLSVYGGQLRLRSGVSSWESGPDCLTASVRTRIVAQHSADTVLLWRIVDGTRTLLYKVSSHPLEWPPNCQLTVGVSPTRFPEGATNSMLAVEGTIRGVSAVATCPYSESGGPNYHPDVRDNYLGVWTNFSSPDGCLFRGTVIGQPAVFEWRATTADIRGRQLDTGDFTLDGLNRSPAGLWTMGAKESCIERIDVGGCGYGVILFAQGYNGEIRQVHANSNFVGVVLTNNSALQALRSCHTGEGNWCGIAALSAAGLKIDGGWGGNNAGINLLVSGDKSSVVVTGGGFGYEGAAGRRNVVLDHVTSAVFLGTDLFMGGNAFPGVEMTDCEGGDFRNLRYSLPDASAGLIRTTRHVGPQPVAGGTRFGGSQTAPLLCPGNT